MDLELLKISTLLAVVLAMASAQRTTQEMVMMQYFERRIVQLEDRLTKCDQDIQQFDLKLYDLSKEMRSQLAVLTGHKAEVQNQVGGVVIRVDRMERDIEYLENKIPDQPQVHMEHDLLEQQVMEERLKKKANLTLGTDCSTVLTGIKSLKIVKRLGATEGSWLKDPSKGSAKVYFFSGTRNDTVLEFPSLKSFIEGNASQSARVLKLPHPWQGTAHVILDGFLYYHRAGTPNQILKVRLRNRTVSDSMLLPGAGHMPAYELSPHTLLDLAVDELGLWAVHADPDFGGNLVMAKLEPEGLSVEQSWDTACPSRGAEAALMVCGTLYVVYNSGYGGRSSVQCLHDIHDSVHSQGAPVVFFPKRYSSHSSMRYHSRDKALYAWDDGYQTIYKLETRSRAEVTFT